MRLAWRETCTQPPVSVTRFAIRQQLESACVCPCSLQMKAVLSFMVLALVACQVQAQIGPACKTIQMVIDTTPSLSMLKLATSLVSDAAASTSIHAALQFTIYNWELQAKYHAVTSTTHHMHVLCCSYRGPGVVFQLAAGPGLSHAVSASHTRLCLADPRVSEDCSEPHGQGHPACSQQQGMQAIAGRVTPSHMDTTAGRSTCKRVYWLAPDVRFCFGPSVGPRCRAQWRRPLPPAAVQSCSARSLGCHFILSGLPHMCW